jgi:hypothetical protein
MGAGGGGGSGDGRCEAVSADPGETRVEDPTATKEPEQGLHRKEAR